MGIHYKNRNCNEVKNAFQWLYIRFALVSRCHWSGRKLQRFICRSLSLFKNTVGFSLQDTVYSLIIFISGVKMLIYLKHYNTAMILKPIYSPLSLGIGGL